MSIVVQFMSIVGNRMSLIVRRKTIGRLAATACPSLFPNTEGFQRLLNASALENHLLAIYDVNTLRCLFYATT